MSAFQHPSRGTKRPKALTGQTRSNSESHLQSTSRLGFEDEGEDSGDEIIDLSRRRKRLQEDRTLDWQRDVVFSPSRINREPSASSLRGHRTSTYKVPSRGSSHSANRGERSSREHAHSSSSSIPPSLRSESSFPSNNQLSSSPYELSQPTYEHRDKQRRSREFRFHDFREDGMRYLWAGTKRREPLICNTAGHEAVLINMLPYLLATIITGWKGHGCGPWADLDRKLKLDNLMRQIWLEVRSRMVEKGEHNEDVDDVPIPCEARRLLDSIGEKRVRMMERIRECVQNHYVFGRDMVQTVRGLLAQKTWMIDYDDSYPRGKCRFLSEIIVKACVSLFFSKERDALGTKDTTKHMFEPIRAETLWLICSMIHIAIKDYEFGVRRTTSFQGQQVKKIYEDMQRGWEGLGQERRELVPRVLQEKIKMQRGCPLEEDIYDVEAIRDSSEEEDNYDLSYENNNEGSQHISSDEVNRGSVHQDNTTQGTGSNRDNMEQGTASERDDMASVRSSEDQERPTDIVNTSESKDEEKLLRRVTKESQTGTLDCRPSWSPITDRAEETRVTNDDTTARDNELKAALNPISFILRFDGREDTLYLNITYTKFKKKYKVARDERIWYQLPAWTMFDDNQGFQKFLKHASVVKIVKATRGTERDWKSPSR